MLVFPNSKINLGLHVTEKRSDGFHNIETVFYPVNWCDALEVIPHTGNAFEFSASGFPISGKLETNLIYKAWLLLTQYRELPPLRVHLHKHIPMGAGLGGGSSDAAWFLNHCNQNFQLHIPEIELLQMASSLGSDCAFFIKNEALLATGKGNEFSPIRLALSDYYLLVVYPNVHSNTALAYQGLRPKKPELALRTTLENHPIQDWQALLVNDFENSIFLKHPEIARLKQQLIGMGALYASMSGSGSAVYGLFEKAPDTASIKHFPHCLQNPA